MKTGNLIRKAREKKGLSQNELAVALDVTQQYISNIENNVTNISFKKLEKLSNVLNVCIKTLVACKESKDFCSSCSIKCERCIYKNNSCNEEVY